MLNQLKISNKKDKKNNPPRSYEEYLNRLKAEREENEKILSEFYAPLEEVVQYNRQVLQDVPAGYNPMLLLKPEPVLGNPMLLLKYDPALRANPMLLIEPKTGFERGIIVQDRHTQEEDNSGNPMLLIEPESNHRDCVILQDFNGQGTNNRRSANK